MNPLPVAAPVRLGLALMLAATVGIASAQTIGYGNSPGGYPGKVSFPGGTGPLQTSISIELYGPAQLHGGYDFSFRTGSSVDGWTFAAGGSIAMSVGQWGDGIDLDNDFVPDILPGTTLFTGTLGATVVGERPATPPFIGSQYGISGTFTTSNLHSAYAAALGLPTGIYSGSFLLGVDGWNPSGSLQPLQVGWREIALTLDTPPIPEPQIYAMLLSGLGLVIAASRSRRSRGHGREVARSREVGVGPRQTPDLQQIHRIFA